MKLKEYLISIYRSLIDEYKEIKNSNEEINQLETSIYEILNKNNLNVLSFASLISSYDYFTIMKGNLKNSRSNIAKTYKTMDDFWDDAEKQSLGQSNYTFWDTYEHGKRRQIERILANKYNSESSVLINSGMSAISVSIQAFPIRENDVILTSKRNYFETFSLLDDLEKGLGIKVIRIDNNNVNHINKLIKQHNPKIILFETVTNSNDPIVIPEVLNLTFKPDTKLIIDNTMQSHNTKWFDIIEKKHFENIIVVESLCKYITPFCVAGVVYGTNNNINKIRYYARNHGQQLQEKAFNFINNGDIANIDIKLDLITVNTNIFFNILNCSPKFRVKLANHNSKENKIFIKGIPSLVFIEISSIHDKNAKRSKTRNIFNQWIENVNKNTDSKLYIRSGFGWNCTYARVYDSSNLNQFDSPCYIRVSIGIEPKEHIVYIAQELKKTFELNLG